MRNGLMVSTLTALAVVFGSPGALWACGAGTGFAGPALQVQNPPNIPNLQPHRPAWGSRSSAPRSTSSALRAR